MKLNINTKYLPSLIFWISLIAVLIYGAVLWSTFTSKAAFHRALQEVVTKDETFADKFSDPYDAHDLVDLMHEKAYREAMNSLAQKDSIQLFINLSDTAIGLSYKGVEIFRSQLIGIHFDPRLAGLSNREYYYLFSRPRSMRTLTASLVKEPIVVRKAPKDAAEAAENPFIPEAQIADPAFIGFAVDSIMQLTLLQDSVDTKEENAALKKFDRSLKKDARKIQKTHWAHNHHPFSIPKMELVVNPRDLRAIYRALPDQVYVVIRD